MVRQRCRQRRRPALRVRASGPAHGGGHRTGELRGTAQPHRRSVRRAVREQRHVLECSGAERDARRRIVRPRFLPYAPPPTSSTRFNFLQLQTSLVVRWEYRVGSTLFLVWTHDRTGTNAGDPNRSWSDEYHDLFSLHPQNTVLLKAAYTISR